MKRYLRLSLMLFALTMTACGLGGPNAPVGGPPSPTPPPIPTKPIITPTLPPSATPADVTGPQAQPMTYLYGSARGERLGIYLLSDSGEFVAPIDLGETANATWPALAPDGDQIAFVAEQSDLLINGIFVYNRVTGSTGQITQADGMHPQWSPDSTKIAFTCNTGGKSIGLQTTATDVCVINADGSGQVNLTADSPALDAYPHWTLDSHIVFMSSRNLTGTGLFSEIYIMNADGSNVTQLTSDKTAWNAYPSVSADGTQIAFESNREVGVGSELYTMAIDGSKQARVTNDKVWNQNPVWSPDGSKLLFAKTGGDGNIDLYLINTDGSNEFRLTKDVGEDGGLRLGHAWLARPVPADTPPHEDTPSVKTTPPNGSSAASNGLLFSASNFNCVEDCLETGIYFVGFDSAGLRKLPISGLFPAWSPDFTRIAYIQDGELFISNADSSDPTQITHAHYNLAAIQWSGDGNQILATCQPYGQFDTCIIDPTTGGISNITQNITIGTGIPYASYISADRILIGQVIVDLLGVQVGSTPTYTSGRVSPDSAQFAFVKDRQLSIGAFPDQGGATRITHDPTTKGFPIWSPDGVRVFFTSAAGDGKIFLWGMRADGAEPAYLMSVRAIAAGPAARPDILNTYLGYSWAP